MRVLIIGLNYLPESTSIGPYTADLAEYLLKYGHEVEVITGFPMAPQWRIWNGYRGEWFRRERINGVSVLRSYLFVPKEPRKTLNRILFDMSFCFSALLAAIASGRCDLVVTISPPLQIGLTGWIVSLFNQGEFFFHLQDLVPDAAIATGMLSEKSWSVRLARMLEKFIYHQAHGIGVICEGFQRNLAAKGVKSDKIKLLPNYIDLEFMHSQESDGSFRSRHGIGADDFLVMYSGSVALKHGLETLVDAAAQLKSEPGIKFIIVGEGPSLTELKNRVTQLQLSNFLFLPLQPRETLPQQLKAADVLVITQKRAVTDIVFPGKLLYYMAAGRPILAAVSAESETGLFIAKHQVGVVTPPEEPIALAEVILHLRQEGTAKMGQRGRKVAEQYFDRQVVLPAFVRHLENLVK